MLKNELLKDVFTDASQKEWSAQNEAPFEMSDSFKAKMQGIISAENTAESMPATEKNRLNISYIKRLMVAAVVMTFFAVISVVTVCGVDEVYGFEMSDTLYGLKLENIVQIPHTSTATDSEAILADAETDDQIIPVNDDTEYTNVYSASSDSDGSAVDSDNCNETVENIDYEMDVCSDVDCSARPATSTDDVTTDEDIAAKFAPRFPDGYERTYIFSNDDVFMLTYESENDKLEFSQRIFSIDEYIPEPENTFVVPYVRGKEGTQYTVIVRPEGNTTILWGNYGYSFILSSSQINYRDLIEIAETLYVFKE